MPERLPTTADFPASATLSITPPPPGQSTSNVLILLHGLGDTHVPFKQLGAQLALPETACVSLQGPAPLPFDLDGWHWGDDIVFDERNGSTEVDTGFKRSTVLLLRDVVRRGLMETCGYLPRQLMLFGFGQGAMLALNVAAEMAEEELGGVVCIGGWLPSTASVPDARRKHKTPVLLCKSRHGSNGCEEAVGKVKDCFGSVEVKEWNRTSDGMPSNRDEMMPIMQFFARRLRSRRGVPSGAVEID